jgi:hypothetical protein
MKPRKTTDYADALRALKETTRAQGFSKHRLTPTGGLEIVIA